MEINVEMIVEIDDAELASRGPKAKVEAPTAMRLAIQNALKKCLGDKVRIVFVSAT